MSEKDQAARTTRDVGYAALSLFAVVAASVVGQIATYPNLIPWYAELIKPSFTPPNWIFAPVWTTLYLLMAFALWRILRLPTQIDGRDAALASFFSQLGLNALRRNRDYVSVLTIDKRAHRRQGQALPMVDWYPASTHFCRYSLWTGILKA